MMIKCLLYFATYHPAPVSSLIDTKIKGTFEKSGDAEPLSFWNWTPNQKSLLDANIPRVILTSYWSTGKTRIQFEKAKILASEGQTVIFVLYYSQSTQNEGDFQDGAPVLLYCSLQNEINHGRNGIQANKRKRENIMANLEIVMTNDLETDVLSTIVLDEPGKLVEKPETSKYKANNIYVVF